MATRSVFFAGLGAGSGTGFDAGFGAGFGFGAILGGPEGPLGRVVNWVGSSEYFTL